jgi:signal peptidase I
MFIISMLGYPVYLAVDAFWVSRRDRNAPLKRYQRWWLYILFWLGFLLASCAFGFSIRAVIAEAFLVPSRSMSPTIQPGDRILVDKLSWSPEKIRRNDVVVFLSEGPGSPMFVARVVGLPGDKIEVKNERVLVNGEPWDDEHAVFQGKLYSSFEPRLANMGPITVPEGHFFELGDNRRMAKDSRLVGPIPMSSLHGVARLIYWSQDRVFPNPRDITHYELGPIRWDRIGQRLDEP